MATGAPMTKGPHLVACQDRGMPEQESYAVAVAMAKVLGGVAESAPSGWSMSRGDLRAAVTAVPVAPLNAVRILGPDTSLAQARSTFDRVAEAGYPYCVQTREACGERIAADLGLAVAEQAPLMVLGDFSPARAGDLQIRPLRTGTLAEHNRLLEEAFEAPAGMFSNLDGPPASRDSTTAYMGSVDGVTVTTGLGIRQDNYLAVLNIGTLAPFRRRGYGAAMTSRIVTDALADGAQTVMLQSSELGLATYERLGFRTVEMWKTWIVPD